MLLRRFSVTELLAVLMDHISTRTGHPVYDHPGDQKSPFYAFESITSKPNNTKTMFMDRYEVPIHVISEPIKGEFSIQPTLDLIQELEEAMSEEITLPCQFLLVNQEYGGIEVLKQDPSNEGHGIVNFAFDICYGYNIK